MRSACFILVVTVGFGCAYMHKHILGSDGYGGAYLSLALGYSFFGHSFTREQRHTSDKYCTFALAAAFCSNRVFSISSNWIRNLNANIICVEASRAAHQELQVPEEGGLPH
jgi:hypothetical protein